MTVETSYKMTSVTYWYVPATRTHYYHSTSPRSRILVSFYIMGPVFNFCGNTLKRAWLSSYGKFPMLSS